MLCYLCCVLLCSDGWCVLCYLVLCSLVLFVLCFVCCALFLMCCAVLYLFLLCFDCLTKGNEHLDIYHYQDWGKRIMSIGLELLPLTLPIHHQSKVTNQGDQVYNRSEHSVTWITSEYSVTCKCITGVIVTTSDIYRDPIVMLHWFQSYGKDH